jgi:hypothetical protein
VIREFTDVAVDGKLLLELVPRTEASSESEAPLISFVEIVCSHR